MDYKNTIITPKTDFPMKAGLPAQSPTTPRRLKPAICFWMKSSANSAQAFRNQDRAYRHLRLHGNRYLRLFRSCICWRRLRLRHLRAPYHFR